MAMLLFYIVVALSTLGVCGDRFSYLECTYNPYQAVCKGGKTLSYTHVGRKQFPTLTNGENCLQLRGNLIQQFPDDMDNLKTVVTLNVAENRISELPENLNVMSKLEILDVSKNRLKTLSLQTQFPVSLRGLLLAENQMKTIPDGIHVPGLFVLDLSNNQFTEIPRQFCVSNQLIRVDFINNPLDGDMSRYVAAVDKCKNINKIPFCLFTDLEYMTCDCSSLAPILGQQSSFCMGTPLRGRPIQCNDGNSSDIVYRGKKLFDVDVQGVKRNCSLYLEQTSDSATPSSTTLGIAMCLSLITGTMNMFT